MLSVFFILVSLIKGDTCNDAISLGKVSDKDLFSEIHTLTSTQTSQWNCLEAAGVVTQPGQVFTFTTDEDVDVVASACNAQTSFASRVIIGTSCTSGVLSSCEVATDASFATCKGQRNRLQFTAKTGTTYYVMVTGVTKNETGSYLLTIQKVPQVMSSYCTEAIEITIPTQYDAEVQSDQTYDSYKTTRGVWFKFTATDTKIFLNSANRHTTMIQPIFVLFKNSSMTLNTKCNKDPSIISTYISSENVIPRLNYDKLIVGDVYYLYIYDYKDTSTNNKAGRVQLYASTSQAADRCETSFAISQSYLSFVIKMSGLEKGRTQCNVENYGFYMNFEGDGNKYVIQTCGTNSLTAEKATGIEIYKDSCGFCEENPALKCGNDTYIVKTFEKNHMYYIRPSSLINTGSISFSMVRLDSTENDQCANAQQIDLIDDGDTFSHVAVGSDKIPSTVGCNTTSQKQGGWYKVVSHRNGLNVQVGVLPRMKSLHKNIILETKSSCDDTTQCSDYNNFSYSTTLNKNESFTLFVSVSQSYPNQYYPYYGAFIIYVTVKNSDKGNSYDLPLVITQLPFTAVDQFHTTTVQHPCDRQGHNNGIYYQYTFLTGKSYVIDTCGLESATTEATLAFGQNDSCAGLNVNKCQDNTGTTVKLTPTEDVTYTFGPIATIGNTGNFFRASRINVYEEKAETEGACDVPTPITTNGRYSFNTLYSKPSRRVCGEVKDGLKGVYYTFKANYSLILLVSTDDLTSFETHISFYKSCQVVVNDSVPKECIAYGDHETTPVATRGTYVKYQMKKDETVLIYVGSASSGATGLGKVDFEWREIEDSEDSNNEDGVSSLSVLLILVFSLVILF
ncbi:hypothetical protein EIN_094890 [Entamoeba invadens IP1]|uniref:Uncharacterized protein n=1 Tax=Entamoeba invadens IP1 TaxID=370355 RepID=A0A0A1U038_ENTIV|nr:hypothetical protein EIN_094890 [Entamoeba invadens IP1]ELP87252.1 hypothetical protein EIN_094890 [Entamoeba invadens IP1]|eukprot:XP_004254023.1 hypothetical protein EIN_094890 [Entamoeba invadens IP1]